MAKEVNNVAVIDLGKTNAKVVLFDRATDCELTSQTAPLESRQDGPYPHLETSGASEFICGALADLNRLHPIEGIAVTAHGSAGAFLSGDGEGDGLALPILDYEFAGPDELAADYEAVRLSFDETLSPRLPGGLNLGAQIFWQEKRFANEVGQSRAYVNYPQYWAWRLTGNAATEMCSMGAHSDLWDPRRRNWSNLVGRMGWERFLAPLRSPFDRMGALRPELARNLGLSADIEVVCGIHDSNALLLPHLISRKPPFTVASTGTWTVLFAVGGSLDGLDPKRDTLANVSAFGDPVPCARFMGGREFSLLAGEAPSEPSEPEIARVIEEKIMALPAFVSGVGPFPEHHGRWTAPPETLTVGERTAAASLYLALMTAESMTIVGAAGPTIVEGPFSANQLSCAALATITGRPVLPSSGASGTSRGAACLFDQQCHSSSIVNEAVAPLRDAGLARYVRQWRDLAGGDP